MALTIKSGNLFKEDVDVIVNPWNRNIFPWWILIPQGVSGQLKKLAGVSPFVELGYRPMRVGEARLTKAGKLNFKGIIHVAGINLFWFATEYSIRQSIQNSIKICEENNFKSIAFPYIGSGTGNFRSEKVEKLFLDYFKTNPISIEVILVKYQLNE